MKSKSKRKSKTKKGRSPSMAARIAGVTDQVKNLTEHTRELETDLMALKRRVSDLENAKTEPDSDHVSESPKTEDKLNTL